MGKVFAGTDEDGRDFAFKMLRSDLADDPDIVMRFLQERSILLELQHANLVSVHDLAREGETIAIVMDLVHGGDLHQYLTKNSTLLPAEVARIGASIASALAYVHDKGIVHGDVKPANILLDGMIPRLTDFGLASVHATDKGRSSLLAGTPQYLAPELAAGGEVSGAADVYSLGIVLYELCCGVTPFAGVSTIEVIRKHGDSTPGRPGGIPDPLWDLISWMLKKEPAGRPAALQAANMLNALEQQLQHEPVAPRLDVPPPPTPNRPAQPFTPLTTGGNKRGLIAVLAVGAVLLLLVGILVGVSIASSDAASTQDGAPAATTTADQPESELPQPTTTTTQEHPSTAPDVVGLTLSEAQEELGLFVEVTTVEAVQPDAVPGTVIEQDPAPGALLSGTMTLTVAAEMEGFYLDELDPVNGGYEYDEKEVVMIAGKSYPHAIADDTDCYELEGRVEYNLGKGYRQLTATAGVGDNTSNADIVVHMEIYGDGRRLFESDLILGKPVPVDVNVSNVLRLKIQWQIAQDGDSCYGNYVVLGDPMLHGLAGEMPKPVVPTT